MEPLVIVLIVLGVVVGAITWLVLFRRRAPATDVQRDRPTIPGATEVRGLARSRAALAARLKGVLTQEAQDWAAVEEALVASDVGVRSATEIVDRVRRGEPRSAGEARAALHRELVASFRDGDRSLDLEGGPAVVVVVGVNGSGKTTTIAKLAAQLSADGRTVVLGAADTFRAAAGDQLRTWGSRLGVDVVGGQDGADPASVAFDAYRAAAARDADVLIVDTAGRLHSKHNLMQELAKVVRVLEREAGRVNEVLIVLDGTTGQNALAQASSFRETASVSGAVLTKLDGTAKGGIAVAVERELGVPIKFIGVGEAVTDLVPFDPKQFVDDLLGDV